MNPQLRQIVDGIKYRRSRRANPPGDSAAAVEEVPTTAAYVDAQLQTSASMDIGIELQVAIVNADLKHALTQSDLAEAARELDVDLGDLCEELASWL